MAKFQRKFELGYDIEPYLDKALEKLNKSLYWVTKELILKYHRYAIENEDGDYQYVVYSKNGESETREVQKNCFRAKEFISRIVDVNETLLTREYISQFKVVGSFRIDFDFADDGGWKIELYEIRKMENGEFYLHIQAGDRFGLSVAEYFIPPRILSNGYEEFLIQFFNELPGKSFGLSKNNLTGNYDFKKFLGFAE